MFNSLWQILFGVGKGVGRVEVRLEQVIAKLDTLTDAMGMLARSLEMVSEKLDEIQAELTPPAAVELEVQTAGTTQGENGMLKVKDDGSVLFTLVAKDAKGNPGAALADAPQWTSSDETLCTLNVAADGMTAVGVLSGTLGTFSVHVASGALAADSDQIEVDPGAAALLEVQVQSS